MTERHSTSTQAGLIFFRPQQVTVTFTFKSKVVRETERIWRRYHLTFRPSVEVGKHVRHRLDLERTAKRRTVVDRLSLDESNRFSPRPAALAAGA
ncbi:MAG TPA: hypothetical protein VMK12_30200 [Anaeromyxobacteraceae bacterium]|nr:hypothetical protein [Anaeromyxobacteraceae bacterium]